MTYKEQALAVHLGNGYFKSCGEIRALAELRELAVALSLPMCCDGMPRLFHMWGYDNLKGKCKYTLVRCTEAYPLGFVPCTPVVGACCACLCGTAAK